MRLDDELARELEDLAGRGLGRSPVTVRSAQGREIVIEGRPALSFSSNDYLGLAGDARLRAALERGARDHGAGAGASRLVSGSMSVHAAAEAALARFVGADDAVLFSTGWAANVGTLAALAGPNDVIVSDALNHASLIDGARLSRARIEVIPHRSVAAARAALERSRDARRRWLVTDGLFSMEGTVAPIGELAELARAYDALLFVDDAHALGVLGPRGAGLAAEAAVRPEVLVGTLGKAFGLAGAFVAGTRTLCAFLRARARSFVYSTAPLPALAAAIPTAATIVAEADPGRARVARHVATLVDAVAKQGWSVRGDARSIVPVVIGDPSRTMALSRALLERGVFVHGLRPPTVPEGTSRLRLVPTAAHLDADIATLIDALGEARRVGA